MYSMKVLFSAPPAISLSLWLSLLLPLELSLLMKLLFRLKGKLLFWWRPIHAVVDIMNYSFFMLSHLKAQSCSRPFLLIKLISEVWLCPALSIDFLPILIYLTGKKKVCIGSTCNFMQTVFQHCQKQYTTTILVSVYRCLVFLHVRLL